MTGKQRNRLLSRRNERTLRGRTKSHKEHVMLKSGLLDIPGNPLGGISALLSRNLSGLGLAL